MRGLLIVLIGWAVLLPLSCVLVHCATSIDDEPAPSREARSWALSALTALRGDQAPPEPPPSARNYRAAGPVVVSAWWRGRLRARSAGSRSLVASVTRARQRFAANAELHALAGWTPAAAEPVRFTLTIPKGYGPLPRGIPILSALGVVPGREGIEASMGERRVVLTPDDLKAGAYYDRAQSTPIADLSFGLDLPRALGVLAERLQLSPDGMRQMRLRRFSALTVSETPYPVPFTAKAARRPLRAAELERAARLGARFVVRHQQPSGAYAYLYDARHDRRLDRGYNLARHAGTTYFLAQAARQLSMPEAHDAARRAINWLGRRFGRCGAAGRLCLHRGERADVGSAALTALAIAEWLRVSDDPELRRLLAGLTAFLRAQQRNDGELMHEYDLVRHRPIDVQHMYYSGEAALAWLKAYRVLGDARDLDAARRVLEHLSTAGWRFVGNRYYYGEEHWTCLAAAEALGLFDVSPVFEFCSRWLEFARATQYGRDETPWNVAGAYGVGPVLLPRLTPASSRTEAAIGVYRMAMRYNADTAVLGQQIEAALGMLLRHQWVPGPRHLMRHPAAALGGVPGTPVALTVRNDFVQHAGSAMLMWAEIMRENPKHR